MYAKRLYRRTVPRMAVATLVTLEQLEKLNRIAAAAGMTRCALLNRWIEEKILELEKAKIQEDENAK